MKPFLTCLLISHNRPKTVMEAIQSLFDQTFQDWKAVIIDSGVLYDKNFFKISDPRIEVIPSKETKRIRKTKNVASWCLNQRLREGLDSEFVMYLGDDDYLYPNAFQSFVTYHTDHPEIGAMYGGSDFSGVGPDGREVYKYELSAKVVRGKGFKPLLCEVDGGQVCYKVELLSRLEGDYWPEGLEDNSCADGLHLEKIGELTPFYPIDVKVAHNRKFVDSKNQGMMLRLMAPMVWKK